MSTCTFFGHRDCPQTIKADLKQILENLICNQSVNNFLVGHQGNFDRIVLSVLDELKIIYPQISYCVVLAYMPDGKQDTYNCETVFPECLENTPRKFAVSKRNDWMLKKSRFVVTYINRSLDGAAQFAQKAKNKAKK